jgi:hypothetical protein
MGSKKRKCAVNEQLEKEFPFITKTRVSDTREMQHMCVETFHQP